MSRVIGCMNSPRLWRMPMASDSMMAAPERIDTLCHWLSESWWKGTRGDRLRVAMARARYDYCLGTA